MPVTIDGSNTPTAGGVGYGDGTELAFTSAGSAGQVLQSNGSSAPSWVALPAGSEIVRQDRTSNTILGTANRGNLINITSGTFTQTFDAAATLGSGWFCYIANNGTGDITLDPNGSETIDGLTSYVMYPGECRLVQCNGTNFITAVIQPFYKTFTSTGTFTYPPGYRALGVACIGGGGGGGSGLRQSSGYPFLPGGSGGGAGGMSFTTITSYTAGASVTATVAAGGAGGASRTTNSSGADGSTGGASSFGSLLSAFGGGPGGGGINAFTNVGGGGGGLTSAGQLGGPGGGPTSGTYSVAGQNTTFYGFGGSSGTGNPNNIDFGGAGCTQNTAGCAVYGGGAGSSRENGSTVIYNGGSSLFGPGGGGHGGVWLQNFTDFGAGAAGGQSGAYTQGGGGAGGASATTGTAGSNGANGANGLCGSGGGGGGSANGGSAGQNGGAGGTGGAPGGGGGGGGGAKNGNSGAGGTGGRGEVRVWGAV